MSAARGDDLHDKFAALFIESKKLDCYQLAVVKRKDTDRMQAGFVHPLGELCICHFVNSVARMVPHLGCRLKHQPLPAVPP